MMNWSTEARVTRGAEAFQPGQAVVLDAGVDLDLVTHGVAAIIPGFGPEGARYGELIPTEEIMRHIAPFCHDHGNRPLPTTWVRDKLGIESVAVSRDTLAVCREFWTAAAPMSVAEAFPRSQWRANTTVYEMLSDAARQATAQLADTGLWPSVPFAVAEDPPSRPTIIGHVHIASVLEPVIEEQLFKVRMATGISQPSIATLVLQQGCAGLFAALQAANALVRSARSDREYVLITAENNMMPVAHQRARALPPYNRDVSHWLFPAIFGEGVGAMLVGRGQRRAAASRSPSSLGGASLIPVGSTWRVDRVTYETVTNEWRVALRRNPGGYHELLIRAADVRRTYRENVTRHAHLAVEQIGGLANLHRLCLHESNPLLVAEAVSALGVSRGRVPSISAKVGTLGCISVFTTLKAAFEDYAQEEGSVDLGYRPRGIACSLIGEAGDHVVAGHICLSRTAPAQPLGRSN